MIIDSYIKSQRFSALASHPAVSDQPASSQPHSFQTFIRLLLRFFRQVFANQSTNSARQWTTGKQLATDDAPFSPEPGAYAAVSATFAGLESQRASFGVGRHIVQMFFTPHATGGG